ncbi:hypothetical protein HAX54_039513, partial [Datura stramonium]|nr:hypothetical protein [Datura stramonium]
FKGFLYLDQLELVGVHFVNDCFESFLSKCPVLQRLVLHGCSGVHHLNICGSKLHQLFVKVGDDFNSISLENAPNLTEVSVMLDKVVLGLESDPAESGLVKFMDDLSKVEVLRLSGKFLQKCSNLLELYIGFYGRAKHEKMSGYLKLWTAQCFPLANFIWSSLTISRVSLLSLSLSGSFSLATAITRDNELHGAPDQTSEALRMSGKLLQLRVALEKKLIVEFTILLVLLSYIGVFGLEPLEALRMSRKLLQLRVPSTVSIDFSSGQ